MSNKLKHAKPYQCVWSSAHEGRYYKRMLSKCRRRAWKNEGHERNLVGIEKRCNWKNW